MSGCQEDQTQQANGKSAVPLPLTSPIPQVEKVPSTQSPIKHTGTNPGQCPGPAPAATMISMFSKESSFPPFPIMLKNTIPAQTKITMMKNWVVFALFTPTVESTS